MVEQHIKRPLPIVPNKPLKYYDFHSIGEHFKTNIKNSKRIKYYHKTNMKSIEPHRMFIYLVEEVKCSFWFYPVTFYKNVIESHAEIK